MQPCPVKAFPRLRVNRSLMQTTIRLFAMPALYVACVRVPSAALVLNVNVIVMMRRPRLIHQACRRRSACVANRNRRQRQFQLRHLLPQNLFRPLLVMTRLLRPKSVVVRARIRCLLKAEV